MYWYVLPITILFFSWNLSNLLREAIDSVSGAWGMGFVMTDLIISAEDFSFFLGGVSMESDFELKSSSVGRFLLLEFSISLLNDDDGECLLFFGLLIFSCCLFVLSFLSKLLTAGWRLLSFLSLNDDFFNWN